MTMLVGAAPAKMPVPVGTPAGVQLVASLKRLSVAPLQVPVVWARAGLASAATPSMVEASKAAGSHPPLERSCLLHRRTRRPRILQKPVFAARAFDDRPLYNLW